MSAPSSSSSSSPSSSPPPPSSSVSSPAAKRPRTEPGSTIVLYGTMDQGRYPTAFEGCPALLAAAQAKGFAIDWGKDHWLVVNRRSSVLSAVRQVRRDDHGEGSPLLNRIALLCDDLVREIVGFFGACE